MSYSIQQIQNGTAIDFSEIQSYPIANYPVDSTDDKPDFQQLYLKFPDNTKMKKDTNYLIKVNLPPNLYYDMNYGVRLIPAPSEQTDLREISDYQFVKFISVPKVSKQGLEPKTVWLYQTFNGEINAAVAEILKDDKGEEIILNVGETDEEFKKRVEEIYPSTAQRALKFFYGETPEGEKIESQENSTTESQESSTAESQESSGTESQDDSTTEPQTITVPAREIIMFYHEDGESVSFYQQEDNKQSNYIVFNDNLMLGNFDTKNDISPQTIYFTVRPDSDNKYDAIFLCLKLIEQDNDIQWVDTTNNNSIPMYGRHIKITNNTTWSYVELPNILSGISNVQSIGVWGRSEQIMCINGQEMRIGPSGYFELDVSGINGLTIDSLSIVNFDNDKYTVDVQYETA